MELVIESSPILDQMFWSNRNWFPYGGIITLKCVKKALKAFHKNKSKYNNEGLP